MSYVSHMSETCLTYDVDAPFDNSHFSSKFSFLLEMSHVSPKEEISHTVHESYLTWINHVSYELPPHTGDGCGEGEQDTSRT